MAYRIIWRRMYLPITEQIKDEILAAIKLLGSKGKVARELGYATRCAGSATTHLLNERTHIKEEHYQRLKEIIK